MKLNYKEIIDQDLIYTALAFLAFGFYLLFTSNLNFQESILVSVGLFAYLILPGYFFSKYFGFKGVFKVGMSVGFSIVLMLTSLYVLNQFFGILLKFWTIIILIIVLSISGFLLWNNQKKSRIVEDKLNSQAD